MMVKVAISCKGNPINYSFKGGTNKMKLGRRVLALLLASMMLLAVTGCKSGDTDTGDTNGSTKESSSTESKSSNSSGETDDEGIDLSERVMIKFIVLGNKPTNGRMENMMEILNVKLIEKVNAELEIQYVEWADWQTQYNLLLASGDDSIDLITTATDWLDTWPNVKKGSFLPLSEDMLKTYAPETWATVPAENWDQCTYEGDIYVIPEDNYAQYINHGMFYRGDWAKEFGIDTINDFETLGKYYQGILDNKEDIVPWDVSGTAANGNALAGGYINSVTDNIAIDGIPIGLSALFFGKSIDDPFTLTSAYLEGDTFENFAVMMNDWAQAGYWREDVLNYNGETRDLMYAAQSGSDQHHSQTYYTTVRPNMDIKQPGSDVQMFPFSEPSKNLVKVSITHGALGIGANSQNPERALMVYDLIRNDEECYRLYNYGIEGIDYVVTDDGKLGRPEGWDRTVDGLDTNFWCGRNDDLELNDAGWYEGKDAMVANYETYAVQYPYGKLIIDTSNIEIKIAAMADVCGNYIPSIAFGKAGDPVAAVAAFKEEIMAAGYQEVFDEIQSQLDAYKTP